MSVIRIAGIVRESIVDGPGIRFVLFTQGCPHHCEGCHNPQTHDVQGGYDCEIDKIFTEATKNKLITGVTLSGGEPFAQAEAVATLAERLKAAGKHLMIYSGYTYEQLCAMAQKDNDIARLLNACDLLVDGKFILAKRNLTLKFRGSENQRCVDLVSSRETGQVVEAEL